ncbi:uncharacterized protein [Musca autumnalis]|uniref:uncharacterized protein n=1 Tax=Musca autumnalis TaxID=221902 RepID=UPI003CF4D24A
MSGLYLMCPICTEDFQMEDTVYSTDCGHLYHFSCMQQWRSRSTSCPQCRHHDPTSHKVFLIENSEPKPSAPTENQEDLKMKLESSIDKINELQEQLQVAESNVFHMQEQFTIEQELRKSYERRVAENKHNDENFLKLHVQYSESEERIKLFMEENERLTVENQFKTSEINAKGDEIRKLKEHLNREIQAGNNENESFRIKYMEKDIELLTKKAAQKESEILELKEKLAQQNSVSSEIVVKSLKQKLQNITEQLEKEITLNTQLAIEKIQLQSRIQRLELKSNSNQETLNETPKSGNNRQRKENKPNTRNITPTAAQAPMTRSKESTTHSVVLQKFPYKEIRYPLEELIVSLASKMNIALAKEDIIKVEVIDKFQPRKPMTTVCIHVAFKAVEHKDKFISQQFLLKENCQIFKTIYIKEYIDREIHGLYLHAVRNLRDVGYESINLQNNTIIAKKNSRDVQGTIIHSKEQVNDLRNKSLRMSNDVNLQPQPQITRETIIDENYYKIIL